MAPDHSQHISPWVATLPTAQLADTTFRDVAADVLVIGGGIAGMTTALLLQRAGKQVVVLEAARVGYGVTTHSTVKVTVGQSTMYTQIAKKLGKTAATAYAAANTAGLLRILELAEELQIDCDSRSGGTSSTRRTSSRASRSSTKPSWSRASGCRRRSRTTSPCPSPSRPRWRSTGRPSSTPASTCSASPVRSSTLVAP